MQSVEIDVVSLRARLVAASAKALERIGEQGTNEIKDDISVRVEVTELTSPGGNTYYQVTQRSAPGEPPRKETGSLFMGVSHEVSEDGDVPILNIVSARVEPHFDLQVSGDKAIEHPYVPQNLEFGTARMAPRPYMTPAVERIADYALDIFAETFADEFNNE